LSVGVGALLARHPSALAKDNTFLSWTPRDYTTTAIKPVEGEGYRLGPVGVKVVIHGGDKEKNLRPQAYVASIEKGSPADGLLAIAAKSGCISSKRLLISQLYQRYS